MCSSKRVFRRTLESICSHLTSEFFTGCTVRRVLQHRQLHYVCRSRLSQTTTTISQAIFRAKRSFCNRYRYDLSDTTIDIQPQSPKGEPCLSVIDYMAWALQRAYTKREMRYYDFVEDKVSYICDLYDWRTYPDNRYFPKRGTGTVEGQGEKGKTFFI